MESKRPIDISNIEDKDLDRQILRAGIVAELDAISLYEQLASMTSSKALKKLLFDIAKEEKTHVWEFQTLLLREDKEFQQEMEEGKREAEVLANL
jgi:rubrerythrin